MDIGKEGKPYVIEPLVEPVPGRISAPPPPEPDFDPMPEPMPEVEPATAPEREKVPA